MSACPLLYVERCRAPGEVGALLRREGLYSSHLATWRAACRRGELAGLAQRRGPKPAPPDPRAKQIAVLERAPAKSTARSRTSGEYRFRLLMPPIFQGIERSEILGQFTKPRSA